MRMLGVQEHPIRFQLLVERLFVEGGFEITREFGNSDFKFDFLARNPEGTTFAVETKYYRTARSQLELLQVAARLLVQESIQQHEAKGVLVTSSVIDPEAINTLEAQLDIYVVDRNVLLRWAAKYPSIFDELSALLEETQVEIEIANIKSSFPVLQQLETAIQLPQKPEEKGTELCQRLQQLPAGKESAHDYELLCVEILDYLFSNSLASGRLQNPTADGLNRFDYVCRILPQSAFWKFLVSHLNSRYILFEFKNYSAPIGQGQVLTTEKYLYERALRRAAILITRQGASDGASAMASSAMRENGKLILVVDDKDMCKMLHMKEKGEDPSDLLFDRADDFLLSLAR